jgi:hypothetical protein
MSNIGIGKNNPSYTLDVVGTIYASGDITAFSDIRNKINLSIIDNALSKIDKISGYTFDVIHKTQNQRRHAGVIAQEIEQVLPEIVYENNEGFKSVAYGNLTSLLIQGIKELKQKYDDLNNQVQLLKNK